MSAQSAPWAPLDFIAYHAAVRPAQRACLDLRSGESVDYRALDDLVSRTAGLLRARLGDPTGERVAVIARNGLDLLLLHYACERTGAIFVPLNWRLSAPELAALIEDAGPGLLIYEQEFGAALAPALAADAALQTIAIDDQADGFRAAVTATAPAPSHPASPDAPWTLLYTSGTTGKPKGVIITRNGAMWGSINLAQMNRIGPDAVMLCDPPLFHTVGLFGICRTALLVGGAVILSDRFSPAATLQRLADPALGVTHYFGVPQIAQMLLDDPGFATADLSRLRAVIIGGAPLPASVAERFADRGIPLSNGFGSTEACSVMHMPHDLARIREKPTHVGYPTPGIEARIVDADGADLADGEVGELWLRGPSVTPGYWNQPELTRAAFSDGWFRTGDAARRDPDGAFQIVDRWKDMYISGGENVYPAEVEAVIGAMTGVAEVAVVGVPDARWGEIGCAFIVKAPDAAFEPADVQAHCATGLARYKHPALVKFVDTLPRTASGKVRKDALRRIVADPGA